MVCVTGDLHRQFDRIFDVEHHFSKEDTLIVAGDFGGVWDGGDEEQFLLDRLETMPFTICFVDGNHENFHLLYKFSEQEWCGGKVHKIRDNVLHLQRGNIFTIEGKKFFVFGGAASHDISGGILDLTSPTLYDDYRNIEESGKPYRIKNLSWWEEEMPSKAEYDLGIQHLKECNYQVDYIITHEAPTAIVQCMIAGAEPDALTKFLQKLDHKVTYSKWFFGHYHADRLVDDKHRCLYKDVIEI